MTIKERFAKYSTEELKVALGFLEEKLKDANNRLNAYRNEGNKEFYDIENENVRSIEATILDVRCAYLARAN